MAREALMKINPNAHIEAYCDNIMSAKFDITFFQSFFCILNALDNIDARRHVNTMCVLANRPLIESGTSGVLGQVIPIFPRCSECYSCTAKPVPKQYPICTIRNHPSLPIHTHAWAHMLWKVLFGAGESETDNFLRDGEASHPLLSSVWNWITVEPAAKSQSGSAKRELTSSQKQQLYQRATQLFHKIFSEDIVSLIEMKADKSQSDNSSSAASQTKTSDSSSNASSSSSDTSSSSTTHSASPRFPQPVSNLLPSSFSIPEDVSQCNMIPSGVEADMATQSLADLSLTFIRSAVEIGARCLTECETQDDAPSFSKDDSLSLNFVFAAANLRSASFNIPFQNRYTSKSLVSSIVPSVAATNAIAGGLVVSSLMNIVAVHYKMQSESKKSSCKEECCKESEKGKVEKMECKKEVNDEVELKKQKRGRDGPKEDESVNEKESLIQVVEENAEEREKQNEFLKQCASALKMCFIQSIPSNGRLLTSSSLSLPNPECAICSKRIINVNVDVDKVTVGEFCEEILKSYLNMEIPTLFLGSKMILDSDVDEDEDAEQALEKQKSNILAAVGVSHASLLTAIDSEDGTEVHLFISHVTDFFQSKRMKRLKEER
ncbi:putative SUMO-activating enzyme subunit 2 [Monocercomonoides exilis]|uniref:putative SUMO-activating enzyme subunit 2 n=1 Tax=Monocercomonoides exilis TaxID=2049356 RepID=UPI003559C8A3|nr:putative SUMO-activating enzyme subunit 2 [Monocercomonoides exilis]|eukprot:MONOS_7853.1-p1 / transcript=MONOS_7853.1 / gene=MONOS_7853 / organism=Monocercomonoides_exilis_PA203 / gene_product=SUMO-activating enzyme subunit 2 / transcript_product=SUMO-activating enzyme subunit 2 / location=Mono_scaffold00280:19068-22972(+) / protein_length=604 / sequence_SO=supercontig / SO=protein_coding / is_pseudo=false